MVTVGIVWKDAGEPGVDWCLGWISPGQIVDRLMMLKAALGRGCAHCERGQPIEDIEIVERNKLTGRWIKFSLCLDCVLDRFPGKDVAWWENHHAPFADHVAEAVQRAPAREFEELMKRTKGAPWHTERVAVG